MAAAKNLDLPDNVFWHSMKGEISRNSKSEIRNHKALYGSKQGKQAGKVSNEP
jgi:hypothetical protein